MCCEVTLKEFTKTDSSVAIYLVILCCRVQQHVCRKYTRYSCEQIVRHLQFYRGAGFQTCIKAQANLADFLFTPERARTPVKALSGGEKARLLLAKLFLKPSNLLVMDEPTNDLDVETLELLEEQLLAYKGTLLIVSHDREFLDHAVTSCYVLAGDGEVRVSAGGYTEAARVMKNVKCKVENAGEKEEGNRKVENVKSRTENAGEKIGGKLSYNEKRELEALPERIATLEAEISEIETALADPSIYSRDNQKALAMTSRLPNARDELDAAETRWLELSERA